MRVTGSINMSGTALAIALVVIVFFYGSGVQAQTPADDQYGSPTETVIPGAAEGQNVDVLSTAGHSENPGSSGADATSSVASSTGASGGSGADHPSSSAGAASGNGSGGILTTALPATGGSLLSLTGLVTLALVGIGLLMFWRRSARN